VAKDIAETIYMKLSNKGVREVYVSLLSQIGKPINKPQIAHIKIKMEKEMKLTSDIRMEAEALAYEKLERITEYTKKIVRGELQLF